MKSSEIRKTFLEFFEDKQHKIVPSAPMVIKNDPTLMFTNAGMNQFKDIFLGNSPVKFARIADTQKCLRVSGKHNDLDEVGHDTYHHTMFEMLGNWSFGDYFKKEAIQWGWELLTAVYGLKKENLYATVFGGDKDDDLPADQEAFDFWKEILPENQILQGSKKDNFWEMGDTGPCGPCSEIHIDLRSEEEKKKIPGRDLVNMDHPEVIEIWNLVFIEFNRLANGKLVQLPAKHVDTGMGFERLTMALQGKKSNYDTDVFQPVIREIGKIAMKKYGENKKVDIAMRVVADHLRAVAFAIADGQLPSNNKAGYVIRRILRRAVRYGFTFLDLKDPFINKLVPVLVAEMGDYFPELHAQQGLITKVILEEGQSFLKTLSHGIRRFEQYIDENPASKVIDGEFAFELFDTFGFPVDLTQLMAKEHGLSVDMIGFNEGLQEQKNRSRQAAEIDTDDWVIVRKGEESGFLGYETLECEAEILKYRKIKTKKKEYYQIVLNQTPFYAESGGQVGDRGVLVNDGEKVFVEDTQKENTLIIHITEKLPSDLSATFTAKVDGEKRRMTMNNHSATHLMHTALKRVLGSHVEQRGSLVDEKRLRFDFSHFSKMTDEEIRKVERMVNAKIRENIPISEQRDVPIADAKEMGAAALFGEKYGDFVRVITFDPAYSIELCGGTHVPATGQIGMFKIISEAAIAAGIRRIEAVTADVLEEMVYEQEDLIGGLKEIFKNQKDLVKSAQALLDEKKALEQQIDEMKREKVAGLKFELKKQALNINGVNFIATKLDGDAQTAKDLAFQMKDIVDDLFLVIGTESDGKANLTLIIAENITKEKGLNAGQIIREIAGEIQGGGGGQPHFATAGGKNPAGIEKAFEKAKAKIVT
jgi:alanyl-tRNA synthetase